VGLRRTARECALQILFQAEFKGEHQEKKSLINAATQKKMVPKVKVFTDCLVEGVTTHQKEIDAIIKTHVEHWSPDRLSIVDRNILRFAIYEMLYLNDVPHKVSIDEAIEISKIYGSENSGAFVNGILDHVHLDLLKTPFVPKSQRAV